MIKKCPKKRWKSYLSTDISENTQNENTEYKDIFSFFERNAGILAAIGLIGTMISFLPSFAEKLNDDVWLGTLSSYQIAFLFLAIIAGITFIFLLFLSIWDRYSESTYRLPFTIILLFFGLFLVSFESFVYFAIQKYLYVNYLILAIYIVIAIFIVCKFRGETKKAKIFGICCVLFFFTLICVNTAIVSYNYLTLVTPDSTNTRIQSDVYYYSTEIPQTYGIGFSPISDKKISFKGYNVTWTTNFGYFFYVDSSIDRIQYLGNSTENHGDVVYWTYNKDELGVSKPIVNISMIVTDQSNKTLASSVAQINWSSTDMARVIT